MQIKTTRKEKREISMQLLVEIKKNDGQQEEIHYDGYSVVGKLNVEGNLKCSLFKNGQEYPDEQWTYSPEYRLLKVRRFA